MTSDGARAGSPCVELKALYDTGPNKYAKKVLPFVQSHPNANWGQDFEIQYSHARQLEHAVQVLPFAWFRLNLPDANQGIQWGPLASAPQLERVRDLFAANCPLGVNDVVALASSPFITNLRRFESWIDIDEETLGSLLFAPLSSSSFTTVRAIFSSF